jgi:hypothetical protein
MKQSTSALDWERSSAHENQPTKLPADAQGRAILGASEAVRALARLKQLLGFLWCLTRQLHRFVIAGKAQTERGVAASDLFTM